MKVLRALIGLGMLTVSAQAGDYSELFSNKLWNVGRYAHNTAGHPMCMVQTHIGWRDNSAHGFFVIKYAVNEGMWVEVAKTNWKLKKNQKYIIQVTFDRNKPWELFGFGVPDKDLSRILFNFEAAAAKEFMDKFRGSEKMAIEFKGKEPGWDISLNGSEEVTLAFINCISSLGTLPQTPETSPEPEPESKPEPKTSKQGQGV